MSDQIPEKTYKNMSMEELTQVASEKLDIDIDWAREISYDDILYLLDHCPFLQIVNTETRPEQAELSIVKAKSGWNIHDYNDAISSSPGQYIFGGGYFRIKSDNAADDDGEGGGIVNPQKGTIVKQAFDTAMEMVELAKAHHWAGIQIVDGHPLMLRAAWIKANQVGIKIHGFKPSAQDYRVQKLVNLSAGQMESLRLELHN